MPLNLGGLFGGKQTPAELIAIFPFPVKESAFVQWDMMTIYSRIITDVLERTQGIPEEQEPLLWDNCVKSESSEGLVTLLSSAMVSMAELFLVFDKGTNVIRKADPTEEAKIRADYKAGNESTAGLYISFKCFYKSEMVKIYSTQEYCAVAALSKLQNISRSLQLKIANLRSTTGLNDSADAKAQGVALAEQLAAGRDLMMDGEDKVDMTVPDLTATKTSLQFIASKQCQYLGMPSSYFDGELAGGLGDKSSADAKAVERGLKPYFFSVVKPVVEALFDADVTFKSSDFDEITSSLELLKTFDITSDEYLSKENKQLIVNKKFGLPEDEIGDPPEKVAAAVPPSTLPTPKPAPQPGT